MFESDGLELGPQRSSSCGRGSLSCVFTFFRADKGGLVNVIVRGDGMMDGGDVFSPSLDIK